MVKAQYMLVVHMRRHTGEKPHKCTVSPGVGEAGMCTQRASCTRGSFLLLQEPAPCQLMSDKLRGLGEGRGGTLTAPSQRGSAKQTTAGLCHQGAAPP